VSPPSEALAANDIVGPASLVVVRHGATEWSRNGRHTGRTDLPLDEGGRAHASTLKARLADRGFSAVFSSPMQRARETCALAGFGDRAQILPELTEWDYGDFEGLTTPEIRLTHPAWTVFFDGAPGGESPDAVGARADRTLQRIAAEAGEGGAAIVFSHGHFLRVLAARWLGLDPREGRHLALDAGRVSELGYERDVRVLTMWNA